MPDFTSADGFPIYRHDKGHPFLFRASLGWTVKNARIVSTNLGMEDHGIFCVNVSFEGDSWGQGTGHKIFGSPYGEKGPWWNCDLGPQLFSILQAVGVDEWEKMVGCKVRIARKDQHSDILAIGNWMRDRWAVLCDRDRVGLETAS